MSETMVMLIVQGISGKLIRQIVVIIVACYTELIGI